MLTSNLGGKGSEVWAGARGERLREGWRRVGGARSEGLKEGWRRVGGARSEGLKEGLCLSFL